MVFRQHDIAIEDGTESEAFDEFMMWGHVADGDYQMNIPNSSVAIPTHEVVQIHVPQHVKNFDEWKAILIEMPAYKAAHISFGEIFTQSFRDKSAENYCRYIVGRFGKDIPVGSPWQPRSQGPDLAAFLMATNWSAKVDSCLVGGSTSRGGYGSQRKFKV